MATQSIKNELLDFMQFATRRIEQGEPGDSLEQLVQQWRSDSEFTEVVDAVRQGLVDDANGQCESVSDAFADIRRQLGIA